MSINLLQVVNRENLLSENFVPKRLITIINRERNVVRTPIYVWKAFKKMAKVAENYGQYLDLTSGFRSYQRQAELFDLFVKEYGYEEAIHMVARPGASEHQLGLGIDISISIDGKMRSDAESFKWVHENCEYFGFILRYKKEFQDVTGVMYEPWHLRYIGLHFSLKIMENPILKAFPLEELVDQNLL